MKLSQHFSLAELTHSTLATEQSIANIPSENQIENLRALCENVLEPLREHAGTPVYINSGYRCRKLNDKVNGSPNSQHLRGEAADIRVPSNTVGNEWFLWLMNNTHFDQLIKERVHRNSKYFWIHVSYSRVHNRQQVINNFIKYK